MRRASTIEAQVQSVVEFRSRLEVLLTVAKKESTGWLSHQWVPRRGKQRDFDAAHRAVAEASGPAALAAQASGILLDLQPPPATGQPPVRVNPIGTWYSALEAPNLLRMEDVTNYCDEVVGILTTQAAQRRVVETSLAGRVARIFGFPREVRAIIEADHGRGLASRTGFVVTVAAEALAFVLGTATMASISWLVVHTI